MEVLLSKKGNSKALDTKSGIPKGRRVNDYGIPRVLGVMNFGPFQRQRGGEVKTWKSPW